ncbi:MAG: hypothetical protein ACKVQJ_09355 [Pyrinomonadaceae bacterium]
MILILKTFSRWLLFIFILAALVSTLLSQSVTPANSLADIEKYLNDLAAKGFSSKAAQLNLATVPEAKVGALEGLKPKVEFGVGFRGIPFFVVEWRMAPNAFLPPHCHPNASVCTVGIDGEAQIRNFEIVGDAPEFSSDKQFRVQETRQGLVSKGRIITLSAKRDNIHTFQAGKNGARGIDISTYHGPNIGFSYLNINKKAANEEKRVFDAHWTKI